MDNSAAGGFEQASTGLCATEYRGSARTEGKSSGIHSYAPCANRAQRYALTDILGREIPEEVAVKTDKDNDFPMNMWEKLGQAG